MSPATRLKTRDYSLPGLYFVTICANFMRCTFGRVNRDKVNLSPLGRIVHETWSEIPLHFGQVNLYSFVVMPNHVQGIIEIAFGLHHATSVRSIGLRPGSLSAIVRSLKAEVTRRARVELDWNGDIWQHNYYDRVIRDGREFSTVTRYIAENPLKWSRNQENLHRQTKVPDAKRAQHAAPLQRRTQK